EYHLPGKPTTGSSTVVAAGLDRYLVVTEIRDRLYAGPVVQDANPARIKPWLGSTRRPRVPGDVLRKHLAKVLVHAQHVDHLGQTSGRVPQGSHERGPEKLAGPPALTSVGLRQPEQHPQARPRERLGTIADVVEAVQVGEQPLGEGPGGVEPSAQLLLAPLQFLHRH